jgi:hypothetical protein
MFMTPLIHAALSAVAVGALLCTLRRAGPRIGGLAAAVPINSIPVLFWLSIERGGTYAASAVPGALYGTGLAVLVGGIFARLTRGRHALQAALLAWLAVGAIVALTWRVSNTPVASIMFALGAMACGRLVLPPLPADDVRRRDGARPSAWISMGVAGAMSLMASALAHHGGARACGLVATVPLVGIFALHAGYRQGGTRVMLRVLGGYLDGMTAKAAFLGALGLAWLLGAGAWAWAVAVAVAALAVLATSSRAPSACPPRCRPSCARA